ncbi:MAG: hypothetical protein L3J02_06015, partial [Henriciella sp.]|nr:hypothetical protein [Henriciella sp.]
MSRIRTGTPATGQRRLHRRRWRTPGDAKPSRDDLIQAAADDADAGVRRLAVVLARLHPRDRADAVVAQLPERDPELAQEVNAPAPSPP